MTDELNNVLDVASESRYVKQGWHAHRSGGTVKFVRDGFVRATVSWIGADWYVIAWEYGMGTGAPAEKWMAERYSTDEVHMHLDMTLNAMWA